MSPSSPGEGGAPDPALTIDAESAGMRLDKALAALVPEGLRGRRRRIEEGGVLLNGAPCREPARRLRAGDALALVPQAPQPEPRQDLARLLGRQGDFCFLFKGAGLHSAALPGKSGDSLEARLHALCAPVLGPGERPELLQRLDLGTSGLVCAALTPAAARAFRAAEAAGQCEKRYLALLTGALEGPVTARRRLDTNDRRTTRPLDEDAGPLRRTDFLPLHVFEGEAGALLSTLLGVVRAEAPPALTFAACRIRRGARHQIRAHAASLGHPLLGDTQYGIPTEAEKYTPAAPRFFLHHGLLAWPGERCSVAPHWPWLEAHLPPEARRRVHGWLETAD
ncbi:MULTISPECIES: pseudouridine synthase [unclassified Desulfovibrio]|uniref:pseudouridine synthase family protein n=1 Tax=unclassified Desulfovibrio TaxID=2593640 RepID=UPI0013ED232F|nr:MULTISPECIES: pseudouridine synthase [unclassified Desulfovibrio]